jgi:hypothetical protein
VLLQNRRKRKDRLSGLLKENELNEGAATHTQRNATQRNENDDKAMVVDFILFLDFIHSFIQRVQYYSTTVLQ